ncbi:MAG TPA: hypothetical protein VNJ08_15535 [Bacteriovoracaceae bacterium]|nr:hypothetical protein [Bacteriovoracaceae bacterium]
MKKFLVAGLALLSLNSFAQSYMVLNNGITLTLDKAGFVYDFNHFFLPYKIQVNGGQFFVSENKLSTIDSSGFLYKKDLKVEKLKGKGLNYYIDEENDLYTVDTKGFYYKYDKEKSFKKASGFGGNFFTVKMDEKKKLTDLYTINTTGNYSKVVLPGLNPVDITTFGGTWFVTKDSVVHTVTKDGFVYSKPEVKVGAIVRRGGNFMIDDSGKLFTVAEDGLLNLPILPANIVVSKIIKVGANYMLDSEGKMFVVDGLGEVIERVIPEHDIRNVKVLSL